MELFANLLVIWMLVTVVLSMIWYLLQQNEAMNNERETWKEERSEFMHTIEQFFDGAAMERKDLYDRLQSGTLSQYKEHQGDPDNQLDEKTDDDEVVDLESAKEELMQTNG